MNRTANTWVQATPDCVLCSFLSQRPGAPDPTRSSNAPSLPVLSGTAFGSGVWWLLSRKCELGLVGNELTFARCQLTGAGS
jgi:hypothetical protein